MLAHPEDWLTLLPDYLNSKGFDVITTLSYSDALKAIQEQELSAVVMVSDWAMKQDDGSPGLIEFLKNKIPTYSLITNTTMHKVGYEWMNQLYKGRFHEYQSMPADVDAIVIWLNEILNHET